MTPAPPLLPGIVMRHEISGAQRAIGVLRFEDGYRVMVDGQARTAPPCPAIERAIAVWTEQVRSAEANGYRLDLAATREATREGARAA